MLQPSWHDSTYISYMPYHPCFLNCRIIRQDRFGIFPQLFPAHRRASLARMGLVLALGRTFLSIGLLFCPPDLAILIKLIFLFIGLSLLFAVVYHLLELVFVDFFGILHVLVHHVHAGHLNFIDVFLGGGPPVGGVGLHRADSPLGKGKHIIFIKYENIIWIIEIV